MWCSNEINCFTEFTLFNHFFVTLTLNVKFDMVMSIIKKFNIYFNESRYQFIKIVLYKNGSFFISMRKSIVQFDPVKSCVCLQYEFSVGRKMYLLHWSIQIHSKLSYRQSGEAIYRHSRNFGLKSLFCTAHIVTFSMALNFRRFSMQIH